MGDEGAETLAGRTDEGQDNRVFSQTFFAVALGDFTAQDGPGDAVRILDAQAGADVFLFFQGRTAHADQFGHVQSRVDLMVLGCREVLADGSVGVRTVQEVLQVDRLGFPVAEVIALFQAIVAADHFVDGMEARRAMISRRSCATKRMKLMMYSGLPLKRLRSFRPVCRRRTGRY